MKITSNTTSDFHLKLLQYFCSYDFIQQTPDETYLLIGQKKKKKKMITLTEPIRFIDRKMIILKKSWMKYFSTATAIGY